MATVDFHSHFFSRPFFQALASQSPLTGDVESRIQAVAARAGIEVPAESVPAHAARWIAELDRHGVDHLCTFASAPEEIPAVVEAAALSRGRLSAFALVNPRVEGAAGRVRALLAKNAIRGVLVFPAMHHFRIDGPEARELLAALEEKSAVIFVHCGLLVVKLRDLFGLPRAQDLAFADPLHVVPAANAFPRTSFVIPHFGAGLFREALLAGVQCPNVLLDSSSSNSWIRTQAPRLRLADVFERALGALGPERILFGTDSNTFPAGWRADRREEQRLALEACGAPAADQEKVLAGNAKRLLGLA